jgi:AraC-like DNA-binding protein
MTAGLLIDHLTGLNLFEDPYRYAINMVSLFLFSASLALLFFPGILYGNEKLNQRMKKKYSFSTLNDQEKSNIMNKLISYMNSTVQPFLDPDLTLVKLSAVLNISSNQLSQAINEKTGMNFNDYVNQYRIDYAKKLLTSPDYQKFTIDAIAMEAGFNSRSPFYNAFKKATGITPRQYILNTRSGVRSIL